MRVIYNYSVQKDYSTEPWFQAGVVAGLVILPISLVLTTTPQMRKIEQLCPLTRSVLAHSQPSLQGQLYCATQLSCKVHFPECCSWWGVGSGPPPAAGGEGRGEDIFPTPHARYDLLSHFSMLRTNSPMLLTLILKSLGYIKIGGHELRRPWSWNQGETRGSNVTKNVLYICM